MRNVVALADIRSRRLRAKLDSFAGNRTPAAVETRQGLIFAERLFCRDDFAVLIDRYGYRTTIGYEDIFDASPMLPIAEIVRLAQWDVIEEDDASQQRHRPDAVVSFPQR